MAQSPAEGLIQALTQALPKHLNDAEALFAARARTILQDWCQQLNLVTREEFDAQTKVLARTRSLLTELEQRLERLSTQQTDKTP